MGAGSQGEQPHRARPLGRGGCGLRRAARAVRRLELARSPQEDSTRPVEQGIAVFRREKNADAIVLYDAAIARFDDADDPEPLKPLVEAMLGAGKVLFTQERFAEAIEVFDRLVDRVRGADFDLRKMGALAINNKVAALNRLGRFDEAMILGQEMLARFGDAARAALDDVISCNADGTEPWQRENLAGALAAKAAFLTELDRRTEALAIFTEIVARFEDDEHETIAYVVSCAREAREQLLEENTDER